MLTWQVIARYLIAALNATDPAFFTRHRPAAFATVATPVSNVFTFQQRATRIMKSLADCPAPRSIEVWYVLLRHAGAACYTSANATGTTTNTIIHTIGRRLFSRTGQQLYCMDKDAEGRCLLEVMADPGMSDYPLTQTALSPCPIPADGVKLIVCRSDLYPDIAAIQ